ncbi:uncharacterized protein BDZ99DRAFT_527504 [Mytilinidion resinicola]|uniref:Uncharacterized protein n=1 Tax=Mytilinidion resinicola TaxID=574789 RepID=A0A6A6Y3W9_9PEZI|nr:uncharacterized protein BDZ99DRAFT_527504 [Mytilinidion resinicola]KAF2802477.1 hypothetical protein BDZ99DRAFT_527504 [Mytilinidion resinicola]
MPHYYGLHTDIRDICAPVPDLMGKPRISFELARQVVNRGVRNYNLSNDFMLAREMAELLKCRPEDIWREHDLRKSIVCHHIMGYDPSAIAANHDVNEQDVRSILLSPGIASINGGLANSPVGHRPNPYGCTLFNSMPALPLTPPSSPQYAEQDLGSMGHHKVTREESPPLGPTGQSLGLQDSMTSGLGYTALHGQALKEKQNRKDHNTLLESLKEKKDYLEHHLALFVRKWLAGNDYNTVMHDLGSFFERVNGYLDKDPIPLNDDDITWLDWPLVDLDDFFKVLLNEAHPGCRWIEATSLELRKLGAHIATARNTPGICLLREGPSSASGHPVQAQAPFTQPYPPQHSSQTASMSNIFGYLAKPQTTPFSSATEQQPAQIHTTMEGTEANTTPQLADSTIEGGPLPQPGFPGTFGQPPQQSKVAQNSPFTNPMPGHLGSSPFGQPTAPQQPSGFELNPQQSSPDAIHEAFLTYAEHKSKDLVKSSKAVMKRIANGKAYEVELHGLLSVLKQSRKKLVVDKIPLNQGDVEWIGWDVEALLAVGQELHNFGSPRGDNEAGKTLDELTELIPRLQTALQTPGVCVMVSKPAQDRASVSTKSHPAPTQPLPANTRGGLPRRNAGQAFMMV